MKKKNYTTNNGNLVRYLYASAVTALNLFQGYAWLIRSRETGRVFVACKGNPIYALNCRVYTP